MSYAEKVVILRGHLEEIFEALENAYGYHDADDLARGFKNVGGTHRPSNLTKKLERASDRVRGYLEAEDVPEE